jgi:hypothetical protein
MESEKEEEGLGLPEKLAVLKKTNNHFHGGKSHH